MRVEIKQAVFQPANLLIDTTAQNHFVSDDAEQEEMRQSKLREVYGLIRWFAEDTKKLKAGRMETILEDSIQLEKLGKQKQAEINAHEEHGGDWAAHQRTASVRGANAKRRCDELGANPPPRASSTAEERAAWQREVDKASRELEAANAELQAAEITERNLWLAKSRKLRDEYAEIAFKLDMLDDELGLLSGKPRDKKIFSSVGLQIGGPEAIGIVSNTPGPGSFGRVA
jgi:hypothetical protein